MSMLLCVLLNSLAVGQPQSTHWYFGDSAAIEFTDIGVTSSTGSSMYSVEGSASISDSLGNLLFYTTGFQVWNRNHEIMPNGDSLFVPMAGIGSTLQEYYNLSLSSITQSAVIIPDPGASNEYFIISNINTPLEQRLEYSIVDMSLDSGLGAVKLARRKIIIDDDLSQVEKLSAVRHGNGRDWWIIRPDLYQTIDSGGIIQTPIDSSYRFYLLTPDGVSFSHEQQIGLSQFPLSVGESTFSKDGSLFGTIDGTTIQVFEFDRCSGFLGERLLLDTFPLTSSRYYGCEFSPDGGKFYVSQEIDKAVIIQYDLDDLDNTGNVSKDTVWGINADYSIGQLQLGPDERIYFTTIELDLFATDSVGTYNSNLGVILAPDSAGVACSVQANSISLAGKRANLGLPNQPNYSLGAIEGSPCDTVTTSVGIEESVMPSIKVYPNPTAGILNIESRNSGDFTLYLLDGRKVFTTNIKAGKNQIELKGGLSGHYLGLVTSNGRVVYSEILIIE